MKVLGAEMAASCDYWNPLGASGEDIADAPASGDRGRIARLRLHSGGGGDLPAWWLTASMVSLGVLAGAGYREATLWVLDSNQRAQQTQQDTRPAPAPGRRW